MTTDRSRRRGRPGRGSFPPTPPGWTVAERRAAGPFPTHVRWITASGKTVEWASRHHRKHASRLSGPPPVHGWWAPRRIGWWIGSLFAVGSACFLVAPFPGVVELVGSAADGMVFFVGSIFFTAAAALQWLETVNTTPPSAAPRRFRALSFEPHRIDWWSSGLQLVGTVLFNVNTFHALQAGLDAEEYDRLVWTPDVVGSACFLLSGYLAYAEISGGALWRRRDGLEWRIAAVNLAGCVAFGISAIAAFWVPAQGSVLDLAAANLFTALGGLCFLVGALLLIAESTSQPAPGAAGRSGSPG